MRITQGSTSRGIGLSLSAKRTASIPNVGSTTSSPKMDAQFGWRKDMVRGAFAASANRDSRPRFTSCLVRYPSSTLSPVS